MHKSLSHINIVKGVCVAFLLIQSLLMIGCLYMIIQAHIKAQGFADDMLGLWYLGWLLLFIYILLFWIEAASRGYMMRPLYIFILILFISISSNAQTFSTDELEPYDYDTTLKGGYTISFKADDSLQYLYLEKGNQTITELASTSRGMLYKNLGYVGADFTHYFVLVHSFGSGNPHYIELIKKTTGENVLLEGAAWIDTNEEKEILLYCDNGVPKPRDKMTLYNLLTGQKQLFNFPADIFSEPQVLNRIHISKLTDKQLVINYDTEKGSKTKTYSR